MKEKLLDLLACPVCGGDLILVHEEPRDDDEIIEGSLSCSKCEREYQIERGVPRFAELSEAEKDKSATAENFGWQWTKFTQADEKYAEQFLGWIQPIQPDFFEGKVILEGGCGKGRHTALAHEWGAKEIVGIDLSAAVDSAFTATRSLPNTHIVQADIFRLPLKKVFDYAFSVGVLHHTPEPKEAFKSLASKVVNGGHISAWVYGNENNDWIIKLVNPVRKGLTSKIGGSALYQLSKLPTAGVFLASKLIFRPLNKLSPAAASNLFYNDYMNHIGNFGWREQHNIVFDHLVAPTAFYISREEFAEWWEEIEATDVEITWHNRNSWAGFGKIRES